MKVKVLGLQVYRNELGDSTNGGVSGKFDEVYVKCPRGAEEIEESDPRLMEVVKGYGGHYHLEPSNGRRSGCVGWMMGGNFAYTCDGRFGFDYPLAIHDRQETQEDYDVLSR